MSSSNRSAILAKIHKVLKKHYKPTPPAAERSVLEHLLFSAILENAEFETAEESFAKLQESFFDWNETRVTTITELAEVMAAVPDSIAAAQRIKKVLQAVFETHYQFDLEALRKLTLGKAISDIEKFPGISPFMVAYLTQNAFAGHAIALGQGALDVLHVVGVATEQELQKQHVAGLERAIQKNKGVEFFSLLHQFGVDIVASPQSTRVKAILAEIDPTAKDRLSTWNVKKAEQTAAAEKKEAAISAKKAARLAAQDSPEPSPAKPAAKSAEPESKKKPAKSEEKPKSHAKEEANSEKPAAAKSLPHKAASEKPGEKAPVKPAKDKEKEKTKPKEKETASAHRITKRKPK